MSSHRQRSRLNKFLVNLAFVFDIRVGLYRRSRYLRSKRKNAKLLRILDRMAILVSFALAAFVCVVQFVVAKSGCCWILQKCLESFFCQLLDDHKQLPPRPACPICRGEFIEIRAKLQCSNCHTICETCCEGSRG